MWIPWLIALVSSSLCVFLWFHEVRRVMLERCGTVKSAARQAALCRKKAAGGDAASKAVLQRTEDIYQQSLELYRQTRQKPWNRLPAALMGFPLTPPERMEVD